MSDQWFVIRGPVVIGPYASKAAAQRETDTDLGGVVSNAVPLGREPIAPGKLTAVNPLSAPEQHELKRLEAVIDRGKQTFVEVGHALMEIREKRLYREHGTFEAYCQERHGFTPQHGRRLMAAAEIAGAIEPVGSLLNERQARPLSALATPQERQDAVTLAQAAAERTSTPLTSTLIRAGVETVQEMRATGGYVTIDDHQVKADAPMPAAVASTINTATEIMQRKTQHIQDNSQWERMDVLIACLGEVGDWVQAMVNRHGGELEVKIVISRKKAPKA